MSPEQLALLAIVQGLTEFLPVSSSGHLNLVHLLSELPDQGPLIDVALHIGSLVAVFIYFWRDVLVLMGGVLDLARLRWTGEARLVSLLALATVPLVVFGVVLLETGLVERLRTVEVIAWTTIIFGLVLWACDRAGGLHRTLERSGLSDAVIIGLSQAVALVPGVSRSGITMSAARALGFERTEAARYSLLLAIPAILASGAGAALELMDPNDPVVLHDAALAAGLAFVSAFLSIWFMMALLRRISMLPFVVYRLALGIVLLWFAYS